MRKLGKKIMQTEVRTFCSVLIILNVLCAGFLLIGMAFPSGADADDEKPIAVIDGTLKVTVGKTVYLDGSLSKDPGGNALNYQWTLESAPQGSNVIIDDDSSTQAKFDPDVVGTYRVKLVVNNGSVDSNPAYATITVTKEAYQW